jgi:hydrogenase maturation protease
MSEGHHCEPRSGEAISVSDDEIASSYKTLLAMTSNEELTDTYSTVILGLGNSLRGDDGVGSAVIEWLDRQALPPGVETIDGGTSGLDIVSILMGRERAIIVDAANVGQAPGRWVRFTSDVAQLKDNNTTLSLHSAGLAEALALGAALNVLPPAIIIYGVQPQNLGWLPHLSDEVHAAVAEVGQAILHELNASFPRVVGGNPEALLA